MSQSATAPPPPAAQPAPAPPAPAAPPKKRFWPAPTGKPVGAGVEDTPGLLNRLQVIGVAAVLIFGLASALIQYLSFEADGRAADDTEQLVRVQEIQTTLLRADAIATNLALLGGSGDPQQIADRDAAYDEAIADVFTLITQAAEAQPADEEALSALNVAVSEYATAIAEARSNLRQNFPVGKEYLSGGSSALRSDALPILENLVTANSERAEESMNGQHPFWLLLIGAVTVGVLIWVSLVLAQRFRRYVNVGVAVAAVLVLVTTLVAAVAAWRGDSQNEGLLDDELTKAVDQAEARTAGNDAKAYESLRLVKRGSGTTYEPLWQESAEVVVDTADTSILPDWEAYVARHNQIVRNDDQDFRGPALRVATADDASGSNQPFTDFDEAAQKLVDDNSETTTDELRAGRAAALVGSILTLLLGLLAAVAVVRGIGARRREYS
ncbi:hypothetical protein [Nocardioides bizhenqiangii]|uniref:Secreted protein n=1 Tax=Nocardioides bizhenqiangii TaxID=3095076 RepID=A0ABZ0ZUQ9_9ACTN|nr:MULTISPECIES: hypothetical protein [unclassified Nocardioides]MDZ5622989.1 hypothetical protein [Nocardioides sp. HM23]WQQ27972.1 hypothetical protein SHK19_06980 [Nocardioides sp. HM61]